MTLSFNSSSKPSLFGGSGVGFCEGISSFSFETIAMLLSTDEVDDNAGSCFIRDEWRQAAAPATVPGVRGTGIQASVQKTTRDTNKRVRIDRIDILEQRCGSIVEWNICQLLRNCNHEARLFQHSHARVSGYENLNRNDF
mmetsp:Transcript_68536/g.198874  ORF Transcript_68536/g.198874 Transcript_68536/m.198874 type:complete len:140 (-) Transcript_68536:108-527(-)